MIDDDRPHLLIVATGMRLFREYLLRSIGPRYRVHMFLSAEPSWERQYISGWTVLPSTLDAEAMAQAARELSGHDRIDGVLCWDEARILPAAHVAAALGLPGGDPEMVNRCRDKHLTRTALEARGVPQPKSVLVDTVEEALVAADEIGYPVILKPRALAASLGVIKVDGPEQLRERFAFTHDSDKPLPEAPHYDVKVLLEEYADGPEISIDTAVIRGRVHPICLARKDLGYPPYCEEIGHVVDGADPLLTDPEILTVLHDTHAALGFTNGMTHTEIKLTATGPKVIEVNARIGGDMIPYLGLRATGIDPGTVAAAVACGQEPPVAADRKLVGAVRFFYPQRDDTVVGGVEFDAGPLPANIDKLVVLATPGATMSPPPKGILTGRVAYATAVAETAEECRTALDAAQVALRIVAPTEEDGR